MLGSGHFLAITMTFKIVTFGCRLNQAESDRISADLSLSGFGQVKKNQQPDLIILNVCAVTHKAVREARQQVAQLKRAYSASKTVVTGCIDENDWPGVDVWVTNKRKKDIVKIICNQFQQRQKTQKHKNTENTKTPAFVKTSAGKAKRIRSFIKIQEGCDNFCSYCIVPLMRGKPQSREVAEIIKDIQDKEKQDIKEVVLTGVNIGLYKITENTETQKTPSPRRAKQNHTITKTLEKNGSFNNVTMKQCNNEETVDLVNLLKIILKNTHIARIRLSSLWPTHLTPQLINLIASEERICPHIHLSIQSGSDTILKAMNRTYSHKDIIKITKKARKKIPELNFTCDIIVGFPGETDQDFQDSCQLVKKVGFSKTHIFKYSKRPKTKASLMPDQISDQLKQSRSRELIKLADRVAQKLKKNFLTTKTKVLWEEKHQGFYYGFTSNYIRVKKPSYKFDIKNTIEEITLEESNLV